MDAPLDPGQLRAVNLAPGKQLLVLGEAGHGKTTVLLRRLSALVRASLVPLEIAVIVPSYGLAASLQSDLRRLGVDVLATTYDAWASGQARRAFRRLPPEAEETPTNVARLKRSPALKTAIAKVAATLPWSNSDPEVHRGAPFAVSWKELELLFGDRLLMDAVVHERPDVGARAVLDVLERTHLQHSRTAEREWAHVTEKRRLRAVDGLKLDVGTPAELARTVDVEDYAVLFEFDRQRSFLMGLPRAKIRKFDVIAIDEAQEFAPLELTLIGESLRDGGTLVVAGDADQQTDATSDFAGWPSVMAHLGQPEHETVTLEVGYRCPPPVTRVARHVLGKAPRERGADGEPFAPALYSTWNSLRECMLAVGAAIDALHEDDPRASVLVVCRAPRTAVLVHSIMKTVVPCRLVFDGRFLKQGGVFVTVVSEVKGLEFDVVIIPDANRDTYPLVPASARELYVAVTRARHQVAFASVGPETPLLPWP